MLNYTDVRRAATSEEKRWNDSRTLVQVHVMSVRGELSPTNAVNHIDEEKAEWKKGWKDGFDYT